MLIVKSNLQNLKIPNVLNQNSSSAIVQNGFGFKWWAITPKRRSPDLVLPSLIFNAVCKTLYEFKNFVLF